MNQPFTASLLLYPEGSIPLPALRSWELLWTEGIGGCDAFSLCAAPPADPSRLKMADRITMEHDGERIFTGLVDETERSVGPQGSALTVCGRGMAARLLDNQVEARLLRRVTTEELLRLYTAPLGITAAQADAAAISNFSVACGSSVMQVVQGFCAHAGLLAPMFDASGRLLLRKQRQAAGMTLTAKNLCSAVFRDQRYGVRSRVKLTHVVSGAKLVASNPDFIARGGRSEAYGQYSGSVTPASWRTAKQRVDASRLEEYTLELCYVGSVNIRPGTVATVSLPEFSVEETLVLSSVRWNGSAQGSTTTLYLRKE